MDGQFPCGVFFSFIIYILDQVCFIVVCLCCLI